MSGRAGRRGKDERGIVVLIIDERMSPTTAKEIVKVGALIAIRIKWVHEGGLAREKPTPWIVHSNWLTTWSWIYCVSKVSIRNLCWKDLSISFNISLLSRPCTTVRLVVSDCWIEVNIVSRRTESIRTTVWSSENRKWRRSGSVL